jgi:hypothetical protein
LNISPDTRRDFECIASSCPRQWLYLLGDEGVVYSEARNRFAGLDAAGVSAYLAFDAGAQIEDLRRIRDAHQPNVASDGLEAIHALAHGIFPDDEPADEPFLDWPDPSAYSGAADIEIHGIPISLAYPTGSLEELCRDSFQNCAPSDKPARWRLSAQPTGSGWAIYINDRKLFFLQQERQLGLGLMHAARSLLYAQGEYDVALHAATIGSGHCGVMLCAPRECGKSTLAAYLIAQGCDLLADEPSLLHLDPWSVSPLRMPISLKEGSWPILRQHWPQLASAPVHVRSDGVKIRMAHPLCCSSQSRRLTHIVFPHYTPSSSAEVESLSPLHTLRLLNEGGMLLAKQFARANFDALLQSVWQTPAYRLQYPSLEEAHRILHEIGCLEK